MHDTPTSWENCQKIDDISTYFPAFNFSQILPRLFTPNKARRIYGWLRSGQYDGM